MIDPDKDAADCARLAGYIAASRGLQRRLGVGLVVATAGSLALFLVSRTVGWLALLGVLIVGICGFWVTAAHISDWKMQIDRLERRSGRAVRRGGRGTATPSR